MNQREVRRLAHRLAWQVMESAIESGFDGLEWFAELNEGDAAKVERQYDVLAQRMFERSREPGVRQGATE